MNEPNNLPVGVCAGCGQPLNTPHTLEIERQKHVDIERALKERAETAERACAEMRDQLEQCRAAFHRHGWDTCQLDGVLAANEEIGADYIKRDKLKPLVEALQPLAACEPMRFERLKPAETWLWKPQTDNYPDIPGISVAHVDAARQALATAKQLGLI